MTATLEIDGISVDYGEVPALRSLSLQAPSGEITALLGANGAGKSTTLRTVSGLMRPRAGSIRYTVDGRTHDITRLKPHEIVKLGISHVPEGRQMFAEMSVHQNLILGAHSRRMSETRESLATVYRYFPVLQQRRGQATGTLSGGEQQMVAIGRGLMSRPRMLLLDEPSLGLAPLIVADILEIIDRLCRQEGLTIVLVEQNVKLALAYADTASVLANGTVTLSGSADALADDPNVQSSYLGAL